MNLLLLNLSFSDFGICLVGTPFSFCASIYHGWYFSDLVCVSYGFLMSLFGIGSITTLTVLSFERYLMISKPLTSSQMTKKRSLLIIVFIWVYSSLVTLPPLLGWGGFGIEGPGISCSVDWEIRSWSNTSYILYMFALGLVFPVLVMGFSYANIIKSIKQSSRSGIQSSVSKAEGRIAAMVFVMGVTFLFAWTPYAVFALIMSFGDQRLVTPEAAVAPAIFAKSSCIYNPIIYVGLNTQFRSAWKGLMCGVMDELPKNITVQQSLSILSEEETSAKMSPSPRKFSRKQIKSLYLDQIPAKFLNIKSEADSKLSTRSVTHIELQPMKSKSECKVDEVNV
ncbi:UNVERIFIED_CONTAM: hypothetical protein RMT77_001210 [Armadillidium vulgare]